MSRLPAGRLGAWPGRCCCSCLPLPCLHTIWGRGPVIRPPFFLLAVDELKGECVQCVAAVQVCHPPGVRFNIEAGHAGAPADFTILDRYGRVENYLVTAAVAAV